MKARIIATGEIKEIVKADLDENCKQLMVRGKTMPTYIDGFRFPFPCIISSDRVFLNNGDIEFIDYSLE